MDFHDLDLNDYWKGNSTLLLKFKPDTSGVTVAVNFWWQSTLTTVLREQPHCRFYHLRVVMGEALGSLIEQLVENCPAADLGSNAGGTLFPYSQLAQLPETSTEMSAACRLSCLTPREVAAVSLTCTLLSRCPDAQQAVVRSRPGPEQESSHMERTPVPKILNGCSSSRNGTGGAVGEWQNPLQLPADPLSCLFRALDTAELVHCLYEVSVKQPSLIQTMFDVHMTPLAAYLFTSKLESAERECVFSNECASEQTVAHDGPSQTLSQAEFYCSLYGACRDPDQTSVHLRYLSTSPCILSPLDPYRVRCAGVPSAARPQAAAVAAGSRNHAQARCPDVLRDSVKFQL
eukprot:1141041-Pelagomonas_calceolata.AAC.6